MEIEEAEKILTKAGYYTEALWVIEDVQYKFKCTNELALQIIE